MTALLLDVPRGADSHYSVSLGCCQGHLFVWMDSAFMTSVDCGTAGSPSSPLEHVPSASLRKHRVSATIAR